MTSLIDSRRKTVAKRTTSRPATSGVNVSDELGASNDRDEPLIIHARVNVVVLDVRIPRAAAAAVGSASTTARIGLGERFVARSRKSAPNT